ncbi:hypothetical protein RclHR1_06440001 [Rhizophagus clarus]|uniref:Uncharacterized protein n=1 Tax=Rhizophagus clarus TaxID=94130 RepID=A0A2Z6RSU9_9GLOM|nr:hypothetical protein RclHR1_06440001 [Rhizophagus clarus]
MWVESGKKAALNKKELKVIAKENRAVFRRARFFSNVLQHAIGSLTDTKFEKELQNQNQSTEDMKEESGDCDEKEGDEKERGSDYEEGGDDDEKDQGNEKKEQKDIVLSSQRFSFLPSEQGAYVEPIIEHVEMSLFRFIVKQEKYIPHKTVRNFTSQCNPPKKDDFSDADLLCLLNFIIQNINLFTLGLDQTLFHGPNNIDPTFLLRNFKVEVRHHNAHGVTNLKGRWSDEKLLRLSTLALEVIVCLGKGSRFTQSIKRKLESELIDRWISTRKRKHEEDDNKCSKRRNMDNEYGKLTDFVLSIVNKLERNEDQVKKIIQLVIAKDERLMNIWESLTTQEDEDLKIKKFVTLANYQFDMVSTSNIIFLDAQPIYI